MGVRIITHLDICSNKTIFKNRKQRLIEISPGGTK